MRFNSQMCPRFQSAIDLLGKRWTAIIIKALLEGPKRFTEIGHTLEVISDRMLSERLKELEAAGVVLRRVLPTTPVHVEYELTEKGHSLSTVMDAISSWADKWIDEEAAREEQRNQSANG
jgi:DNA-binding HxlR family transcriptional regulator